jgi:histidinol-phosphate aminotransferase
VEVVWKVKIPYNLSVASEQAILGSLEDAPLLKERVCLIVEERERLFERLDAIPDVRPYPSAGNFILCEVKGIPARDVRDRLRERGILIRCFDSPGLQNCVRISVERPTIRTASSRRLRRLERKLRLTHRNSRAKDTRNRHR